MILGGLELICNLLESKDQQVLAAVCFAIANIARYQPIRIQYLYILTNQNTLY